MELRGESADVAPDEHDADERKEGNEERDAGDVVDHPRPPGIGSLNEGEQNGEDERDAAPAEPDIPVVVPFLGDGIVEACAASAEVGERKKGLRGSGFGVGHRERVSVDLGSHKNSASGGN